MKACISRFDESVGRQWTMGASVAGLFMWGEGGWGGLRGLACVEKIGH